MRGGLVPAPLAQSIGTSITFETDDRTALRGRWFAPVTPARGVVLIVPAMATESAFYSTFAAWLAERGYAAMTFDYRGYGESASGSMRSVSNDLMRWAHDARDALNYAHGRAEGLPVTWMGHSFGGQALPFTDHRLLSKAMHICSGTGYWKLNSLPARLGAPLLWKVIAPTAIAAYGYYPGSKLRMLGDLPAPVMRQWATWCMDPDYLLGEFPVARQRFAEVELPMRSLSFTDDKLMSRASIAKLNSLYTGAQLTQARFSPNDLGVSAIGHHGFFRRAHTPLWNDQVLPFLQTRPA